MFVWADRRFLNRHDITGELGEDATGGDWAIRSLDQGKSWIDRQRLFCAPNGPVTKILQTQSGHIVVAVQSYLRKPGRKVTRTYVSSDNGKAWWGSNFVDLGGHGHHDGGFEATFEELRDGTLWMLIRTNWDRVWEAYSNDHGLSWRVTKPSNIEASTSPGYLTRLASGRLAPVWNRSHPEGKDCFPRRSGLAPLNDAWWPDDHLRQLGSLERKRGNRCCGQ